MNSNKIFSMIFMYWEKFLGVSHKDVNICLTYASFINSYCYFSHGLYQLWSFCSFILIPSPDPTPHELMSVLKVGFWNKCTCSALEETHYSFKQQ